jgi:hypothetical protein
MADEMDNDTKLKIYLLIISRYRKLISENESRSVSEIRQRVSPYSDEIRKISNKILLNGLQPYSYDKDFISAAEQAMDFVRKIKTCRFMITFWMEFDEMLEVGAAGAMDKAILLTALLRSFGSENASVTVTKSSTPYVGFTWKDEKFLFSPESGSIFKAQDIRRVFEEDPPDYSFNDLRLEHHDL